MTISAPVHGAGLGLGLQGGGHGVFLGYGPPQGAVWGRPGRGEGREGYAACCAASTPAMKKQRKISAAALS